MTVASADPLSDLLRSLQVQSTVYCRSTMSTPWGFRVEARPRPSFHLLTEGEGWLEIDGHLEATRLRTGDLVILPTGSAHQLRDSPMSPVRPLDDILASHPVPNGQLRYGGGGATAALLCGGFTINGQQVHPVLTALPPVLHIAGADGRPAPWLDGTLRLITAEMNSADPGAEVVVTRLTDVLLLQAIRRSLATAGNGTAAFPGLADSRIARVLSAMHSHPDRVWTLALLARTASMSPSAFSGRFRELTGEAPMRYLARLRLVRAAHYLRSGRDGLLSIAARTGYDSDVSLSKAFKRHFGVAPGAYRRAPKQTG